MTDTNNDTLSTIVAHKGSVSRVASVSARANVIGDSRANTE